MSACAGPADVYRPRPTTRWRGALFGLALPLAVEALAPAVAAAQTPASEYAVKAAYLYKFAPFVQWPPASLAPGEPLQLCVVGADPFGRLLDVAATGQMVGD